MNDGAAPQAVGWTSLLDRLWRILAAPRLTVILLVWMAAVLALGVILPQAPSNIDDPIVRSQWLAGLPVAARPAVERLLPIGIFNLLDTIWFRLPMVLLLAHALVVLANWGRGIWYRARCQPNETTPLGQSFQLEGDWHEPAEHAGQYLVHRLKEAGYRVASAPRGDASEHSQNLYVASRWPWSWLGLAGIYLGLALASIGLILTGWLGEVYELNLAPGTPSSLPISALKAPDLVLEETTVKGDNALRPTTGAATLSVSTGPGESQELILALHSSRLLRGAWVTLTDLRPTIELTATDLENDDPILLQAFSPPGSAQESVRVSLIGDPETRFVGVPSQNVTLHISPHQDTQWPSPPGQSPIDDGRQTEVQTPGPSFLLSLFRGAESMPSQETPLRSGDSVDFEGVRYLASFSHDATLRLQNTLWWIAAATGWGMTALSFIVLVIAAPIYVQGSTQAVGKGSHVALKIDVLGDKARHRRELERLLLPPQG